MCAAVIQNDTQLSKVLGKYNMNEDGYEERMINDKMDGVCEG